jgi:bacillithiol biosynthesis cysteine-adding enzyme BshC
MQVILAQQQRRGAPPRALEAAQKLADERTVAIVTGQQAGLFGGPLFTLLKAITALKLANQVARDDRGPVVAAFWIDAEDHDWDEVRTCGILDEALALRRIELPARTGEPPAAVGTLQLGQSIRGVLDELERVLPSTEFRSGLMAELRSAYAPGVTMSAAFGRWLERLLGPRGLIVFDSSDPASKPLVADIFSRELSLPGTTAKLATLAGASLEGQGYHAQVRTADNGVALFYLGESRQPIRQANGAFLVGDRQVPADGLLQEAREQPARFSPSVLLRPVVQDAMFPTICYVAGPNELGYLSQLRGVYKQFGVPMPLMYPRVTATVLDAAAVRFLTKHGLPLEALQPQDEAALNQLIEREIPPAVGESFTAAASSIETQMTRLADSVPAIDPTLEGAARSTLKRMQHDLDTLHAKMIQAAKRRDETLRRQFLRTRSLAFPAGDPQERAVGFVSFLNLYGQTLIDRLHDELPLDLGTHWVVTA